MPLAKIEVRKSRSPSEISAMIEAVYLSQREALIVLNEPPLENWGLCGGIPASELDLGFNLKV